MLPHNPIQYNQYQNEKCRIHPQSPTSSATKKTKIITWYGRCVVWIYIYIWNWNCDSIMCSKFKFVIFWGPFYFVICIYLALYYIVIICYVCCYFCYAVTLVRVWMRRYLPLFVGFTSCLCGVAMLVYHQFYGWHIMYNVMYMYVLFFFFV